MPQVRAGLFEALANLLPPSGILCMGPFPRIFVKNRTGHIYIFKNKFVLFAVVVFVFEGNMMHIIMLCLS